MFVSLSARPIAAIAVVVFAILFIWLGGAEHETPVPNWVLQDVINHEIPKTVKGITATRMDLVLTDHADVTMAVEGEKFGKSFKMTIHALGQPDIKHSHGGALYFSPDQIEIKNFAYSGTPPGELLKKGAERYLMNHPGMQNALTDAAPHIETWMTKSAEEAAVLVLRQMPIYHYKGTAGFFLNASVKSVRIDNGQLLITWSLWELTERAIFAGIGLMVMIAVCLLAFTMAL